MLSAASRQDRRPQELPQQISFDQMHGRPAMAPETAVAERDQGDDIFYTPRAEIANRVAPGKPCAGGCQPDRLGVVHEDRIRRGRRGGAPSSAALRCWCSRARALGRGRSGSTPPPAGRWRAPSPPAGFTGAQGPLARSGRPGRAGRSPGVAGRRGRQGRRSTPARPRPPPPRPIRR